MEIVIRSWLDFGPIVHWHLQVPLNRKMALGVVLVELLNCRGIGALNPRPQYHPTIGTPTYKTVWYRQPDNLAGSPQIRRIE